MRLQTEWVHFAVEGKEVRGYLSRPARVDGPLPGVVVIQEAFGVDAHIRDVVERFATCGYAAFAPDLFSSGGTPAWLTPDRMELAKRFLERIPFSSWSDPSRRAPELARLSPESAPLIEETLAVVFPSERPWAQYVGTLLAGRRWLSAGPSRGRKVGSVGFCMGGALSMRLACADPELAAAVSFYGYAPPADQVPGVEAAVLAHYAEQDPRINATMAPLVEAMRAHGKAFEHHTYPGTQHTFFNDTGARFHVDAARDAWARTLAFLATYLE